MALFGGKKKDEGESQSVPEVTPTGAPGAGMVMPGTGDKAEKVKSSKPKKLKENTGLAYRVLVRPIISEKGSHLAQDNTYLFQVTKSASREQVARAIDSVYGITPSKVRLMNISGKSRRQRNVQGWTSDWKKAIVTLPEGKKLDLYEGV